MLCYTSSEFPGYRRKVAVIAVLAPCFLAVGLVTPLQAQDEASSTERLELMQSVIASFEVSSDEGNSKSDLRLSNAPLLRYSDPTRDLMDDSVLLDAGVWQLGKSGRPKAFVVLEIYRASETSAVLAYEFVSLTPEKFSMVSKSPETIRWQADGTNAKRAELSGAMEPAKTEGGRLIQMRKLARRFRVVEKLGESTIACRLMPQPIARYTAEPDGIIDGAVFVFSNGTNPEAGVILECDLSSWSYSAFRLGAAEISVELDEQKIATFDSFGDYGATTGAYTSTSHPIALPK